MDYSRWRKMIGDAVSLAVMVVRIRMKGIWLRFSYKPDVATYVKDRLKKRFRTTLVYLDRQNGKLYFYLEIPGGFTATDKLNTAKMFGLTRREIYFVKTRENYWKFTLLPDGVTKVQELINTFPDWRKAANTGKSAEDFEPEEIRYLTREEKISNRKYREKAWVDIFEVFDYLFTFPILGYILKQAYWHWDTLKKYKDKIPSDPDDLRMYPFVLFLVFLLWILAWTFKIWATFVCILVMGYAIRRLKKSLKIKYL